MRHSFATYHLAYFQDAGKTAHELGHHNPDMLFAHYRNLATEAQGREWFSIFPSNE
jgi:integrase